MNPSAQWVIAAVTAGLPTCAVLVSLLIHNQRLGDLEGRVDQRLGGLEKRMDQRFTDIRESFCSDLLRVEQMMDARLKRLEEHLQR